MSDMTERNCNKCIHHTSGDCDSLDCKMQTVEDVKNEAVDEYVKVVVKELEELKMRYFLTIANTGDEKLDCAYEQVGDALDKAIEIVKQETKQYEECYKDCGDCEAYYKEKYHCPKFCKVIKETVKEIEENHNGWIPCSERLPKYGEVVMCSCTNGGITISCITHKGVKPSKSVRFGQHSVIAWQPLPHPYQPKGEHDEHTK